METSALADDSERMLDPRSVALQRVGGWITAAVLGVASLGGVAVALLVVDLGPVARIAVVLGWALLAAVLIFAAHVWPALEYRYARYRVGPRGLEIRRGVLWREHAFVPRSRVQHTDVSQGPLERRFGLSTLVVYTAGTAHASVHLSGLTRETALAIRDFLVSTGSGDGV